MMKRLRYTILLIICICSLTGCVRMKTGMEITLLGKVNLSLLYAVMDFSDLPDDLFDEIPVDEDDMYERLSTFRDEGWDVQRYEKGKYSGFTAEMKGIPLNKLASKMEYSDTTFSYIELFHKGNNYVLNWDVYDEFDKSDVKEFRKYIEQAGGYCEFQLRLPRRVINSNATHVSDDGRTLTWDLLNMKDSTIHVEFSVFTAFIPLLVFGLTLAVAVGIIIALAASNGMKKQSPKDSSETDIVAYTPYGVFAPHSDDPPWWYTPQWYIPPSDASPWCVPEADEPRWYVYSSDGQYVWYQQPSFDQLYEEAHITGLL